MNNTAAPAVTPKMSAAKMVAWLDAEIATGTKSMDALTKLQAELAEVIGQDAQLGWDQHRRAHRAWFKVTTR